MPKYIVIDNQVHFRQSFPVAVLQSLFVTLYALDIPVRDGLNKSYPHMVAITESEF